MELRLIYPNAHAFGYNFMHAKSPFLASFRPILYIDGPDEMRTESGLA